MKKIILLLMIIGAGQLCRAQSCLTRNGFIGFYSKTPLEDIRAENKQVYAVIDPGKKNLAISLLVKGFLFRKELMQTHFNENYAESDKYPKATFTGSYSGEVDFSKDGSYPVQVSGPLTFHGVTRNITVPATLEVKGGSLTGKSVFQLEPGDFNIKIPSLVREKIAQKIDVHVSVGCTPSK
ncbi:YceI family protein [Paraflavisolibacter sp. H34]|uniref:YceI family protein n=1 Tax=Huijunlia imazamoxiresistens TaxID=3127457 RepID=UPI0030162756